MAIPEKVARLIGPIGEPQIWEVERGAIRRFADAIDDPNPLYRDVEYARNSKYGTIMAPTGFCGWPTKGGLMESMGSIMGPMVNAGYPVIVDAGVEFESFVPIRAGDILSCHSKITNIAEKTTKSGKGMLMLTAEANFLNQNGDKALTVRSSFICREL
jgi:acyl dehydratase